jgi:hypothetical protein
MYCRTVLGSFSDYFRTRVTGWDDDPHTLRGKDGRPVLVVAVEEELTEAAQAVVHLMYHGVVPEGMSAVELAQVRRKLGMLLFPLAADTCEYTASFVEPTLHRVDERPGA